MVIATNNAPTIRVIFFMVMFFRYLGIKRYRDKGLPHPLGWGQTLLLNQELMSVLDNNSAVRSIHLLTENIVHRRFEVESRSIFRDVLYAHGIAIHQIGIFSLRIPNEAGILLYKNIAGLV